MQKHMPEFYALIGALKAEGMFGKVTEFKIKEGLR